MTLAPRTLLDLGLMQPSPPDEPGPFAFAEPGHVEELLDVAGFDDAIVETVDLNFHYPTSDDVFETLADISPSASVILAELSPADHSRFRDVLIGAARAVRADRRRHRAARAGAHRRRDRVATGRRQHPRSHPTVAPTTTRPERRFVGLSMPFAALPHVSRAARKSRPFPVTEPSPDSNGDVPSLRPGTEAGE